MLYEKYWYLEGAIAKRYISEDKKINELFFVSPDWWKAINISNKVSNVAEEVINVIGNWRPIKKDDYEAIKEGRLTIKELLSR